MAITAQTVATRARLLLNDTDGVRWGDAEVLGWINDGRRDWAAINPRLWGATAKRVVTLAAGCQQALNSLAGVSDAFSLLDVVQNVNADSTYGPLVRLTSRGQLDQFDANWRKKTGTYVQNWFKDDANQFAFWVYPAVEGGLLEVNIGVTPADLSALTQTAVPMDVMATTLMHYVLYRAYSKETQSEVSMKRAAAYLELFTAAASNKE